MVVETSPDFVGISDVDGRPIFVNSAALAMVGLTWDEMLETRVAEYFVPEERDLVRTTVLPCVLDRGRWSGELTFQHFKTGARIPVLYSVFRIDDPDTGQPTHFATITRDLTEQKRNNAELVAAQQRVASILTAAEVGTWTHEIGSNRFHADDNLARMLGMSAAEEGVSAGDFTSRIHPEDRKRVETALRASLETGCPFYAEYRVPQSDGSDRWMIARGNVERDGDGRATYLPGAVLDITDRKKAELELANERNKLQTIFERSPAAMALWRGEDLVFEMANSTFEAIFANRELLGRPLLEAAPELEDQAFPGLLRRVLRTGEPYVGREVLAKIAGPEGGSLEDHYYDFTYVRIEASDGTPYGVYDHAIDVTDRVLDRRAREELVAALQRSEGNLRLLAESERYARSTAEHASRMKDEFLATLSHELRTPLSAILGWSQLLRTSALGTEELQEGLQTIERNARIQAQLIEDLLDMSRITAGTLRLDLQPIEPHSFIEAAIEMLRPAAAEKGIEVEIRLDAQAGPISADFHRMQQVVWNLLTNAIKFTPPGGQVVVRLSLRGSNVEISVSDSGQGIPPEFLPHVFDRFRQADSSTNRQHGGLGLGLAIVKQLVELHGGKVHASSEGQDRGTTFTVTLPFRRLTPASDSRLQIAAETRDAPGWRNIDLSGLEILVVDDYADAGELLKRVLEACGAHVMTASSAAEGIDAIRTHKPNLVVSDIAMPGTDGYEFLRMVRALPLHEGGEVPAVALTAFARTEDRTQALMAGYLAHLAKPVDPSELVATVAAISGRARPGV